MEKLPILTGEKVVLRPITDARHRQHRALAQHPLGAR